MQCKDFKPGYRRYVGEVGGTGGGRDAAKKEICRRLSSSCLKIQGRRSREHRFPDQQNSVKLFIAFIKVT